MATPNDPVPPQKPAAAANPAPKPAAPAANGGAPAPRPAAPAQPGAVAPRPAAPAQPGAVAPKPAAPAQPGAVAPRPAAPAQPGAVVSKPVVPAQPGAAAPRPVTPAQPGAVAPKPAAPTQPGAAAPRPAAPAQGGAAPAPRPATPAQPGATPPKPAAPQAGATPPKPAAPQAGAAPKPAAGTPPARPAVPQAGAAPRPVAPAPPGAKPPAPAAAGARPGVPIKPTPPSPPARPGVKQPEAGAQVPLKPAGGAPGEAARTPIKPTPPKPAAAAARPTPKGAPVIKKSTPLLKEKPAKAGGPRKIIDVLVEMKALDPALLDELADEARATGDAPEQIALSRGLIDEEKLMRAAAELAGLKYVNLDETRPTPEALQLVPETMATVYKVLPLSYRKDEGLLTVVVGDPANLSALDDLRNFLGIREVGAVVTTPTALENGLAKAYAGKEESIVDIIKALEDDEELNERFSRGHRESSIDLDDLINIQDSAPVRKLINMVLLMAIKDRASDIHFEPFEDEYKLRYRCDGVMYEMVPPPRHLAMAIASRVKVMANLDIAERRLPQDGRIELNVGGNSVDMRVSILPTMFGESIVIRVLDRTVVNLDLEKIGMEPGTLETFRTLIHKPNGIVLVTGPTGSGKTTTLYSALTELNEITEKIITTEDPVEYEIDGIVQVQINSEIGMTFASALRSILRQDPDIVLVGEIRDLETAQIAIQASLTGHIVFSTLHTNDAPSTITRLRDMGVEPFLIVATLEGILAQRLVRKICVDCRAEYEPSAEMLMELNLRPADIQGKKFFYGRGCDRCNNTGHKGRCGLYEQIVMNDELRDLVVSGASTDQLRQACRKMGMNTLREAGLRAMFNGVTTIDEIIRETVLEDEG